MILEAINPSTQKKLPGNFSIATIDEIDAKVRTAFKAWKLYKKTAGKEKAVFLRTIAQEIENLGAELIKRAMAESGLPQGRLEGERGRTCNQLRLFADLVEEGSWVNAVIDEAISDRQPFPKADIRKTSMTLGPVAVFTASNFPLAFSTAGGDTASALAAGCPVIVKAHPAHLGTNALVAEAIKKAITKCNLPKGVFSSLQGTIETGQALVKHPLIKAVGFTGSHRGGKALFDLANSRPEPIPVYAEMGSINPIFILPKKLKADVAALATQLAASINLGAGQFCTNPGLLVVEKGDDAIQFLQALKSEFAKQAGAFMLNENIYKAYERNKSACLQTEGVALNTELGTITEDWKGTPAFATVAAKDFLQHNHLQEEVFGPFSLVVICDDEGERIKVAESLNGQLTATLMGEEEELKEVITFVELLTQRAGRVIFNNVPTGVEVCPAMHHGGPFPATSNSLYTSVGTDAIRRFVRPIAFQNTPDFLLPPELQSGNPLKIWRMVNGKRVKA